MFSFLEPKLSELPDIIVSPLSVTYFTAVKYLFKGLNIRWELESVCMIVKTIDPLVQVLRI